jgi:tRNA G10  N-methylase Trm11
VRVRRGDVRRLSLADSSVDVIATSPPYLHAIDYLRGHRLSLVWMGWSIADLRDIRSSAIGAPRAHSAADVDADQIAGAASERKLSPQALAVVRRYVLDLDCTFAELVRVLRPSGRLRLVVAGSTVKGVRVSIVRIVERLAEDHGLVQLDRTRRSLRADRRYLPPPTKAAGGLERRVRYEQIVTFARS